MSTHSEQFQAVMTDEPTRPTSAVFDRMCDDERWGGYGYLGARWIAILMHVDPKVLEEADERIFTFAADLGWTAEDLFEWANSTLGRTVGGRVLRDEADEADWADVYDYFRLPR